MKYMEMNLKAWTEKVRVRRQLRRIMKASKIQPPTIRFVHVPVFINTGALLRF